ncbi:MAG TPA: hypothetical protein EYG85_08155 [Crocinitomix sp.]|nr:hypothetical protein [Crocinitomix sp.]
MKQLILSLNILVFYTINSFSQSGFLGSIYNIDLEVNSALITLDAYNSTRSKTILESDNSVVYRTVILDNSYRIGLNRVLSDNFTIGVSFKTGALNLNNERVRIDSIVPSPANNYAVNNFSLLTDIMARNNAFTFGFKKYSKGLSPIGKYFGFSLSYGIAKSVQDQILYYGETNEVDRNFFYTRKSVTNIGETKLAYQGKVQSTVIRYYFGQTIPITRKIGVDISASFPLLRYYRSAFLSKLALTVNNGALTLNPNIYDENIDLSIMRGLRRNDGVSLKVGVKVFL